MDNPKGIARKRLEKQLDILWRQRVLEKFSSSCAVCGRKNGIQAHHIFSRTHKSTRWDIENGIALCSGHHLWAHREPEEFRRFLIHRLGEEKYNELYEKSRKPSHFSISDLERILEELNESRKEKSK